MSEQRSDLAETMLTADVAGLSMKQSQEMEESDISKGSLEVRRWKESCPRVDGKNPTHSCATNAVT